MDLKRIRFDTNRFYTELNQERTTRGLSWRAIAAELGIAHSTFTRMHTKHQAPSADTLAKMVAWLIGTKPPYTTTSPREPAERG